MKSSDNGIVSFQVYKHLNSTIIIVVAILNMVSLVLAWNLDKDTHV